MLFSSKWKAKENLLIVTCTMLLRQLELSCCCYSYWITSATALLEVRCWHWYQHSKSPGLHSFVDAVIFANAPIDSNHPCWLLLFYNCSTTVAICSLVSQSQNLCCRGCLIALLRFLVSEAIDMKIPLKLLLVFLSFGKDFWEM